MGGSYDPGVNQSDISSSIESTNEAKQRQRDFINALSNGVGNQNQVFQSALGTMGQLQDQSQGGGANPALAQLALNTGHNVQNQAALLAGQRGVGANPGLAARQIGQLGSGVQQEAVGQAAVLRANQQLAAQQQLQQQQALLGQIAGGQVAAQQQGISNLGNIALGQSGQYLGAQGQAGKTAVENSFGSKLAGVFGAGLGAAGTIGAAALTGGASIPAQVAAGTATGIGNSVRSATNSPMAQVPFYSAGGKVGGKAKVQGDSTSNDTVPIMASPGEVVIPRSHVKDPKKVAAFINATLGMNLKVGGKKS